MEVPSATGRPRYNTEYLMLEIAPRSSMYPAMGVSSRMKIPWRSHSRFRSESGLSPRRCIHDVHVIHTHCMTIGHTFKGPTPQRAHTLSKGSIIESEAVTRLKAIGSPSRLRPTRSPQNVLVRSPWFSRRYQRHVGGAFTGLVAGKMPVRPTKSWIVAWSTPVRGRTTRGCA